MRAFAGQRDRYRPLASPLCSSSAPEDVVSGFLGLFPFSTIYIADLDAIEGREANILIMRRLAVTFPQVKFWRDAGVQSEVGVAANVLPVIGSETLARIAPAASSAALRSPNGILSLDFRGQEFLGPLDLPNSPELWPQRVIVMTLARVGVDQGPDYNALQSIKARAGNREIFAAGGVRGVEDLDSLANLGICGALVASALHNGKLGRHDLDGVAATGSIAS